MLSQLEKALNLAKKTGDRLIVFDQLKTDRALVILGLDEYEKLALKSEAKANLTEADLLDTINRNIAAWKNDSNPDNSDLTAANFFSAKNKQKNYEYSEDWPEADLENEVEIDAKQKNIWSGNSAKKLWSIPREIKEGAEEIIEEDRQYLEEVPF